MDPEYLEALEETFEDRQEKFSRPRERTVFSDDFSRERKNRFSLRERRKRAREKKSAF